MIRNSVPSLRLLAGLAATTIVWWPAPAEAHLVTTGLGPVYDGVPHVLLSPDDLLPVLVMGLLAGLNGPKAGRRVLFTLTLAWLVGGLAGPAAGHPSVPGGVTAMSCLVLGGLTAADRRLSPSVATRLEPEADLTWR